MPDEHQAPPKISVVARDPARLRQLVRERSYKVLADELGLSKTYIGEIGVGHRTSVSVAVASDLEDALGLAPGELFQVDPCIADVTRPYLQ